jgi:flagellar basal-body rod protein FlgF
MNRGIYATATGMLAAQAQMDVLANNLANVSTTGYKRDGLAFAERFEREMRAGGGLGEVLGKLGTGAAQVAQFTIFEPGPLMATGNTLDVAIGSPKGCFAVQTPQGLCYTRDGSFQLNTERQLTTKAGHPVLDARGNPITLGFGRIAIEDDGTVMVNEVEAGQIAVYDGPFRKIGDNLYLATDAKPIEDAQLRGGHLEGSNVNAVEAMVDMISLNRAFELAQRSIQQQDDLTQRLIQSLRDQ